jgi:hypothetical protein
MGEKRPRAYPKLSILARSKDKIRHARYRTGQGAEKAYPVHL